MARSVGTEEARGVLGALRRLLHAPDLTEGTGCSIMGGAAMVAILLTVVAIYVAMNAQGADESASSEPPAATAETADSAPAASDAASAVENPTAVGQAVDAVARPAIEDVYGQAQLSRAPDTEALIVSLWYDIPVDPVDGDGERLRNAFLEHGATLDPANPDMDYHAGEEFMVLVDTGDPAYKTARVSVSPDTRTVYVNADRSE